MSPIPTVVCWKLPNYLEPTDVFCGVQLLNDLGNCLKRFVWFRLLRVTDHSETE